MNSSLWSAGRNTHLKIVAVSLMASIIVVAIGINARLDNGANERIGTDSNRGQGRQDQDLYGQQWIDRALSAPNSRHG